MATFLWLALLWLPPTDNGVSALVGGGAVVMSEPIVKPPPPPPRG